MSLFRNPANQRMFYSVALFFILVGAAVFALGLVQWILTWWGWSFGWPAAKMLGGLCLAALGYIVLELELIRNK